MQKAIVDAERPRRTPRLWPFQVGRFVVGCGLGLWPIQCATLADIGDAGIEIS